MIGAPITIEAARPPYVQFETRALPDRAASEASGRVVFKDVDFVMITPSGSRDIVEKIAEEWLREINKKALDDLYPVLWAQHFRAKFDEWKKGNELPENGLALKMWPIITPAELQHCLNANVRTVEDLAQLNEEGMALIGMGGRSLKQKAEAYIQAANNGGKLAERIGSLEVALSTLTEQLAREREKNAELEAEIGKGRKKAA
jgi:hypothetical protein